MNNQGRKTLKDMKLIIESQMNLVEKMSGEEQDKFDNLSEGLQASERGQKFEENVDLLDNLAGLLQECLDVIDEIIE